MAESYGSFLIGSDDQIMKSVDAVNIACGFHGGDPLTIQNTIKSAIKWGKQIGAHPSFPDLMGFGRRMMTLPSDELSALIRYQIGVVKAVTESLGGSLQHVKTHGALYNLAAIDVTTAKIIVDIITKIDPHLELIAPHSSVQAKVAIEAGCKVLFESFGDRRYHIDGRLVSRSLPNAVIDEPQEILIQINDILNGRVKTLEGDYIEIISDTICLHGDHPRVVDTIDLLDMTFDRGHY
jgi:5-oxoprolinase (ATP-hydrolysing) subunit A